MWARDTLERYLLGQITGPYRCEISKAAKAVDTHQVRSVEWAPRALTDYREVDGSMALDRVH